jgi:gliding motility-associated-like protein
MSEYGKIIDFRVYNRWGDKVYDISTSDNKNGWDGTLNGKEQPADLYIYYITIQNFNEIISKESHVTLIR